MYVDDGTSTPGIPLLIRSINVYTSRSIPSKPAWLCSANILANANEIGGEFECIRVTKEHDGLDNKFGN